MNANQLFAEDVVFFPFVEGNQETIALVKSHGGVVVDDSEASSKPITVVFLSTPTQDDTLNLLIARFAKAEILHTQWIYDSIKTNARLATNSYRLREFESSTFKRQKVTALSAAYFAVRDTKETTTAALPEPHLRPWKILKKSLYVLDARAEQHQGNAAANTYKIAGFDLDGTLIVTKSGAVHAKAIDDWKLFHATLVRDKLISLAKKGYTLCIFSNQNGIAKGHVTAAEVQRKIEAIIGRLKLPLLVFLGTADDMMRKPRIGAWHEMASLLSGKGEECIDKDTSFYCGDAAGRPKIPGRAKDFAATDYKFALNAEIPFFTPEHLFLGSKQRIHTQFDTWDLGFEPKLIKFNHSKEPVLDPIGAQAAKPGQEMIILVGSPASGKSFFASNYLSSYVAVSQDELRTKIKCKIKCLDAIEKKKSVVIDDTNRDPRSRNLWIAIAKDKNLPVRCFVMDVNKPLSMHLNTFRALTKQKNVPLVAIHGFYKNYVVPTVKEGFVEVIKVQFQIDCNISNEHKALLRSYI